MNSPWDPWLPPPHRQTDSLTLRLLVISFYNNNRKPTIKKWSPSHRLWESNRLSLQPPDILLRKQPGKAAMSDSISVSQPGFGFPKNMFPLTRLSASSEIPMELALLRTCVIKTRLQWWVLRRAHVAWSAGCYMQTGCYTLSRVRMSGGSGEITRCLL